MRTINVTYDENGLKESLTDEGIHFEQELNIKVIATFKNYTYDLKDEVRCYWYCNGASSNEIATRTAGTSPTPDTYSCEIPSEYLSQGVMVIGWEITDKETDVQTQENVLKEVRRFEPIRLNIREFVPTGTSQGTYKNAYTVSLAVDSTITEDATKGGGNPYVENIENSKDAKFKFYNLKGDKGDKGDDGADGLTTSITMNGETITQVGGNINLGTVITEHQSLSNYYNKGQVNSALSVKANSSDVNTALEGKVSVESGKGLISTNISNQLSVDSNQLSVISSGGLAVNNNIYSGGKIYVQNAIDGDVQIRSGIDVLHSLSAKANASSVYTKAEVNSLINAVNQFNISIVSTLPISDIDTHTIYLVPKTVAETNDVYDEFIYILNPQTEIGAWEHIGTTEVDLSQYYTKTEVDTRLSAKANSSDVYSKDYIDNSIYSKAQTQGYVASFYYNKSEVDTALSGKVGFTDYATAQTGGVIKIWQGTQAEYDALGTYDSNTLYMVVESNV